MQARLRQQSFGFKGQIPLGSPFILPIFKVNSSELSPLSPPTCPFYTRTTPHHESSFYAKAGQQRGEAHKKETVRLWMRKSDSFKQFAIDLISFDTKGWSHSFSPGRCPLKPKAEKVTEKKASSWSFQKCFNGVQGGFCGQVYCFLVRREHATCSVMYSR